MTTRDRSAAHPPNHERENHAVAVLAQEMADDPRPLLHALVDAALDVCDARATAEGRRKDDFLATLAHELRNPLSAIAGATSILQQRTLPPSASQAVGIIARQTQHMSRLVADLLDIARIVNGKLALELERCDLRTIVTQAVEPRRAQIDRRSQTLSVELGSDAALVDGDPVRLAQVISNLLDNAAKYTPERGDIAVSVFCDRAHCSVSVRDSGAGIPAEDARRIFLPFTQLRTSVGSQEGGLGLGLALVHTLAELHGGTVTVTSAGTGQGSCFTLRLPASGQDDGSE